MPRDRGPAAPHPGVPRWRGALALLVLAASLVVLPRASGSDDAAGVSFILTPVADATVVEADPDTNLGGANELFADRSPGHEAHLRFDVPALPGLLRRATLRLFVTNSTPKAPNVHVTAGEWAEPSITWSNRPAAGAMVSGQGKLRSRSWVEYDVTTAVTGEGPLGLALVPRSRDGVVFSSREVSGGGPELVVETAEDPTTSLTTISTDEISSTTTSTLEEETTTTSTTTTTATWTPVEETTTTSTATTTTTRPDPAPAPVSGTSCHSGWRTAHDVADLPVGVTEVSGLVASQVHPGWGWMIRDSGNPASLYSLRLDGSDVTVHESPVPGARNRDWEEVAYTTGADGRGVLWILENMGNEWSGNRRIYQVEEPDPRTGDPARLLGTYEFAYPDRQWNTEILFAFDGDLVLITKTQPRMYRFAGPLSRGNVNVPDFVGALPDISAPTLGGVSPDRRFLIVSNYSSLRVFENRGALSDLHSLIARQPIHRESMARDDREGGSFFPAGSCDFVMTAESGTVWRLANGG